MRRRLPPDAAAACCCCWGRDVDDDDLFIGLSCSYALLGQAAADDYLHLLWPTAAFPLALPPWRPHGGDDSAEDGLPVRQLLLIII